MQLCQIKQTTTNPGVVRATSENKPPRFYGPIGNHPPFGMVGGCLLPTHQGHVAPRGEVHRTSWLRRNPAWWTGTLCNCLQRMIHPWLASIECTSQPRKNCPCLAGTECTCALRRVSPWLSSTECTIYCG
jgi:hypothetical protein